MPGYIWVHLGIHGHTYLANDYQCVSLLTELVITNLSTEQIITGLWIDLLTKQFSLTCLGECHSLIKHALEGRNTVEIQ